MSDLHLAYQETDHLRHLLASWDAHVAAEGPIVRNRWTDLAIWPSARNATVAGSTGIEGNPLTPSQVDELLSGGHIEARPADIREVFNYNNALDLANRAALRPDFEWSQELIRRVNAAVMEELEDDDRGEYRQGPVTVGGLFAPPDHRRLASLMAELVDWLEQNDGTHPLVRAGLTHLNVVSIHPWLNGNGRTARVAGSLMLMRCGIGSPELLNVESEIRANRDRYFDVLQQSHGAIYEPAEHSATPWLEFFAETCVNRVAIQNRVSAAIPGDVGLLIMEIQNAGDISAWPWILLSARLGPVRTTRIATLLGLSPGRVRAILSEITAAGWLVPEGERRGRRYVPSPRLLDLPLRTPGLMESLRGEESNEAASTPDPAE
jgi:hypothetical protein